MAKNRLAVNAKYFKASKVNTEMGHVMRLFADDENVLPELKGNTFGTRDDLIQARFNHAVSNMKNVKKNSNILIDAVLVLPEEQFNLAKMTQDEINKAIMKTMIDMRDEFGLEPLGYKMHLDEGSYNPDGSIKLNPHAHMMFANICSKDVSISIEKKITVKDEHGKAMRDPEKPSKYLYERDENGKAKTETHEVQLNGKMPLQYLKGRGTGSAWSRMQDLAVNNFAKHGFERGLSKEITNARHLNKAQHLERVISERNTQIENLDSEIAQKTNKVNILDSKIDAFKERLNKAFDGVREIFSNAVRGDIESLRNAAEKVSNTVEHMTTPEIEIIEDVVGDYENEFEPAIKGESSHELNMFKANLERQKQAQEWKNPHADKPDLERPKEKL